MYIRKWLNKRGNAFIAAESSDLGDGGSITFADCNRRVSLEFWFHNEKSKKECKKKLDILINTLTEFRDHLFKEE